jgi:hypothetical protein
MIKWSERAKFAIPKLFEPLQDIDVYVEDENDEVFYRYLFNYATNETIKITKVFSKNGRKNVIEAARSHDQKKRKALFIIDGDLSWVKGEPAPKIVGLYRHDAYCVENLLLCEKALSFVISQEKVILIEEAATRFSFKSWIRMIQPPLIELFSAFATLHNFIPTEPTVSMRVGKLCDEHGSEHILNPLKVKDVTTSLLQKIEENTEPKLVAKFYKKIFKRLNNLSNPLDAISGKDFLIPLINFRLNSFGCRIETKSLRVRLACAGDRNRFSSLANALSQTAKGYK